MSEGELKNKSQLYNKNQAIGVFDSGVGGISILRSLVHGLPMENFFYVGDSVNAPYGSRSEEEVRNLTLDIVENKILKRKSDGTYCEDGCKAAVVACNTATAAAIRVLRQRNPEAKIIGLEPAIKPAALTYPEGRVLMMATAVTVSSEKYAALKSRFEDKTEIISIACPGIVEAVENSSVNSIEFEKYLETLLLPFRENKVDAVVLGCTHFPFVKKEIIKALGYMPDFFDSSDGVSRQIIRLLKEDDLLRSENPNRKIEIYNSKGIEKEELSRKLLEMPL